MYAWPANCALWINLIVLSEKLSLKPPFSGPIDPNCWSQHRCIRAYSSVSPRCSPSPVDSNQRTRTGFPAVRGKLDQMLAAIWFAIWLTFECDSPTVYTLGGVEIDWNRDKCHVDKRKWIILWLSRLFFLLFCRADSEVPSNTVFEPGNETIIRDIIQIGTDNTRWTDTKALKYPLGLAVKWLVVPLDSKQRWHIFQKSISIC